jgi:hypothetical protein
MNIDSRMQRHYFIRGGEHIYERSTSIDKDYVIVEGANHGLGPCPGCSMLQAARTTTTLGSIFSIM